MTQSLPSRIIMGPDVHLPLRLGRLITRSFCLLFPMLSSLVRKVRDKLLGTYTFALSHSFPVL